MCRSGCNANVPLRVIKMGSTNAYSFEEWYGAFIPEQHTRAIEKRCNFYFLHEHPLPDGRTVELCPAEVGRFEALGYRAETNQRWPLYKSDDMGVHPNADQPWAWGDGGDGPPPLDAMIMKALGFVDSAISLYEPGVGGFGPDCTAEIVKRIALHSSVGTVVVAISDALDGSWTAETRDRLLRDSPATPNLNNYFPKHLVRSLAFVYEKDNIPCSATYLNISGHNNEAIKMLTNLKTMPSDIITNMRARNELGVVGEDLLRNDYIWHLNLLYARR